MIATYIHLLSRTAQKIRKATIKDRHSYLKQQAQIHKDKINDTSSKATRQASTTLYQTNQQKETMLHVA
jgi:hypothetical protein